jgi:16S rRNA (guanine527-N7)-methyltransferase
VKKSFHHVTARAVAPLDRLIESTWHLIEPQGSLLAMKGERAASEVQELSPATLARGVEIELKEIPFGGNVSRIVVVRRRK